MTRNFNNKFRVFTTPKYRFLVQFPEKDYDIFHNLFISRISILHKCLNCQKQLKGRQTKFCSRQCKNQYNNHNYQCYNLQQKRGRERKLALIKLKGEKCSQCGYNTNHAALEFHHRNPDKKNFALDLRSLSNRKWETILLEAEKCILVCSNCHAEIHNPECAL